MTPITAIDIKRGTGTNVPTVNHTMKTGVTGSMSMKPTNLPIDKNGSAISKKGKVVPILQENIRPVRPYKKRKSVTNDASFNSKRLKEQELLFEQMILSGPPNPSQFMMATSNTVEIKRFWEISPPATSDQKQSQIEGENKKTSR